MAPKRLYFDLETTGLLPQLRTPQGRLHCVAITDLDTLADSYYGPAVPKGWDWLETEEGGFRPDAIHLAALEAPSGSAEDAVREIATADLSVAHNGITFDYEALTILYPWFVRPAKAWDSFVAAKVVWPYDTLAEPDFRRVKMGKMPAFLAKRHSLKAWGYRLGDNKTEYQGDPRIKDPAERKARMWDEWNPWLAAYMMQDNRPGVKLWQLIERRVGWVEPEKADLVWPELVFAVEHEVARIIFEQEQHGIHFDRHKATLLAAELQNEKAKIEAQLVETFGSWWAASPVQTPAVDRNVKMPEFPDVTVKRFSEKTGKELAPYVGPPLCRYSTDAPFTPIERTTFSPSSRDHLGQRLQDVYGWKPKKFGKNGKPTVDETVLEEIPEAVMPVAVRRLILDFFVVNKTLGTLAKGAKAWLNLCTEENRIHGQMDTSGAVTGRGTHKNPNLSGTPAVKKEKVVLEDGTKTERVVKGLPGRYGWECRELFIADDGWEQTGVDASSLELIDLGHYLQPYDEGAFSARVCDPSRDPHQENAEVAGVTRADAKTTIYLKIYGGSAYKLSLDPAIIVLPEEVPALLGYRGLSMMLSNLAKRFDQNFVDKLDDMQKARISKARQIIVALDAGITGLKDLMDAVKDAAKKGWLKGMDGRKLYVRNDYAALNTLLQSAGAQTCKLWMMLVHRKLAALGYVKGRDFKQTLWVHDELQFTHKPGMGPVIKQVAEEAMKEAGRILGLRGEYRTDGKTGANWAECH